MTITGEDYDLAAGGSSTTGTITLAGGGETDTVTFSGGDNITVRSHLVRTLLT